MAKTYLDVVNIALRDINEVPLTSANFDSAVGLQAFTKEAINRAMLDIINYNDEWPWLANAPLTGKRPHSNSLLTVQGTGVYAYDSGVDNVDFDTVYLVETDEEGKEELTVLEFHELHDLSNFLNRTEGPPKYVYKPYEGNGLGILPIPDDEYEIRYVSWKEPTVLELAEDLLPFPDRFYTVLVSRARYYLWMFRENAQQASIALNEYDSNIKMMYKQLMLPKSKQMRAV